MYHQTAVQPFYRGAVLLPSAGRISRPPTRKGGRTRSVDGHPRLDAATSGRCHGVPTLVRGNYGFVRSVRSRGIVRLDIRWWHLVGGAVFAGVFVVPMLGIAVYGISTIRSMEAGLASDAFGGPRAGFLLVEACFVAALVVAVPGLALSLYRDANGAVDPAWTPNARLYGVLGLLYPVSLLVAGFYLYRRYRRVGIGGLPVDGSLPRDRLVASQWWYLIAIGPGLFLAGFGWLLFPYRIAPTFAGGLYVRITGLVLLSGAGLVLFNFGLAADLEQVRGSAVDWTPGTRRYMLSSMLVPGAIPLVAIVYLFNRHRHVGVP